MILLRAAALAFLVAAAWSLPTTGAHAPASDAAPLHLTERLGSNEVAELEADTRPVLARPVHQPLGLPTQEQVDGEQRVRVRRTLGPRFADAAPIVVTGWVSRTHGARAPLGPTLVSLRRAGQGATLDATFATTLPPGTAARVHAVAHRPPPAVQEIEIPDVPVPAGARLTFAIGIDEAGVGFGPLEFGVDACSTQSACTPLFRETLDPANAEADGWNDRRVDLASYAGQAPSLRFWSRSMDGASPAFGLWADPTVVARRVPSADAPSVIVLSIDTLSAGHLPFHGYPRETAPFFEEVVAGNGTVFERAYAASSTTGPSHMTAFTGLLPHRHGVYGNLVQQGLAPEIRPLAERLRDAGFTTAAITENGPLAAKRGFARGFGSYRENKSSGSVHGPRGLAAETLGEGARWVLDHRDERYFLFLHTFEVHTPYTPRGAYTDAFPDPLPDSKDVPESYSPDRYDREIRQMDDELRAFHEKLAHAEVWDDTLLVVLSDHGEAFGEHDRMHHGGVVYDEVLHVPLVFYGPGIPASRIETPVGLIDLTPTLLELTGSPPTDTTTGESLAGLLSGEPVDANRTLYSESWEPQLATLGNGRTRNVAVAPPGLVARRGRWKALSETRDGPIQVFDTTADPKESEDLAKSQRPEVQEVTSLLEAFRRTVQQSQTAEKPSAPVAESSDPARTEKLRHLGYIE